MKFKIIKSSPPATIPPSDMDKHEVICGDANPKGNIGLYFKGCCKKKLPIEEAYRCTGCGGWFHRDCIFEHFEKEERHSSAHNALKKIQDYCNNCEGNIDKLIIRGLCNHGLDRSFLPPKLL